MQCSVCVCVCVCVCVSLHGSVKRTRMKRSALVFVSVIKKGQYYVVNTVIACI